MAGAISGPCKTQLVTGVSIAGSVQLFWLHQEGKSIVKKRAQVARRKDKLSAMWLLNEAACLGLTAALLFVHMLGNAYAVGYNNSAMRRASTLPEQYIPEISEALKKAGLKWEDFKVTDNSCGPHPPQESLAQEVSACLPWLTSKAGFC